MKFDYYYNFESPSHPEWGTIHCGLYDNQVYYLEMDVIRVLKIVYNDQMFPIDGIVYTASFFEVSETNESKDVFIKAQGIVSLIKESGYNPKSVITYGLIGDSCMEVILDYWGHSSEEEFAELMKMFAGTYAVAIANLASFQINDNQYLALIESLENENSSLRKQLAESNEVINKHLPMNSRDFVA